MGSYKVAAGKSWNVISYYFNSVLTKSLNISTLTTWEVKWEKSIPNKTHDHISFAGRNKNEVKCRIFKVKARVLMWKKHSDAVALCTKIRVFI